MKILCHQVNAHLWNKVEPFISSLGTKVTKKQLRYGMADVLAVTAEEGETLVGVLIGAYFESVAVAQVHAVVVGWPWRDSHVENQMFEAFASFIRRRWFCDQAHFMYTAGDTTMLQLLCSLKPEETNRLRTLDHNSIEPVTLNHAVSC
jgi:hypothetical protein